MSGMDVVAETFSGLAANGCADTVPAASAATSINFCISNSLRGSRLGTAVVSGAREDFAAIRQQDVARVCGRGPVLGLVGIDGDRVAGFQRILAPSKPVKRIGWSPFDGPIHRVAVSIFHINI